MRPRLAIVLAILVLTPLALLAWIGARGVREEREAVARRYRGILSSRLEEASLRVADVLSRRERELLRAAESAVLDAEGLRAWVRRLPFASQAFLLERDGVLLFPPPAGPLSDAEREFLARAGQVLREKDRFFRDAERAGARPAGGYTAPGPALSSAWYSWYWGGDIQVLFWQRLPAGPVLGVELNRARFIADVIAALPSDEALPPELASDRIRLVDSRGETIHQWGSHAPADGARPAVELQLVPPLAPWRLQCFPAGAALEDPLARRLTVQLVLGLSALGLVLAGLAVYFIRESSRDLRDARRRVSFANQVSHELRTPLTNIRMYAELLQGSLLDDGAEPAESVEALGSPTILPPAGGDGPPSAREAKLREYAEVIAGESQRLSRLIGNILTFARMERDALRLRPRPLVPDEAISAVIERFRPALRSRGIEVLFRPGAPGRVSLDPDALEQILNNLLSNVEKYAPGSGTVEVSSSQDGAATTITVADRGPGIPEKHREEVFVPFRRLNDRLTEGVSGTGLGLSIARDLARLHGGDLRLVPSASGARFEAVLGNGLPGDGAPREAT